MLRHIFGGWGWGWGCELSGLAWKRGLVFVRGRGRGGKGRGFLYVGGVGDTM